MAGLSSQLLASKMETVRDLLLNILELDSYTVWRSFPLSVTSGRAIILTKSCLTGATYWYEHDRKGFSP
jgi:hypothetical protein